MLTIRKIGTVMKTHNLAIFVSGNGTNCENIVSYFSGHPTINVALVVSSSSKAGALERIKPYFITSSVVSKELLNSVGFVEKLQTEYHITFIVLAGFLWPIPDILVKAYSHRIINIHPSLLPRHGGKGMYGRHVHEAVKACGDAVTGMTVHWVSDEIDGGAIISQFSTPVLPTDTVDDIAQKEHQLEMQYYPSEIERILTTLNP